MPTTQDADDRPLAHRLRRVVRHVWGDVMSVYWANTVPWRVLKSGALVFLGFFAWAGSSVLLSYRPEWTVLQYTRAYGFVVLFWGPLTHLLVVPLSIRLRRTARRQLVRRVVRNASKLNLSVFLAVVLVLGTYPVGPMTMDFQGALGADGVHDVDPDLECVADEETVRCQVEAVEEIDHVVVLSGDRELVRDDAAPFELSFRIDETERVVGQQQFAIEVRDADGETLRRFVRTVPQVRS